MNNKIKKDFKKINELVYDDDFIKHYDDNHDFVVKTYIAIEVVNEFIKNIEETGLYENKELDLFENNFGLTKDEWAIVELNGLVKKTSNFFSQDKVGFGKTRYSGDPEVHRKVLEIIVKENNLSLEYEN